jgi:hypothetical protein
MITICKVGRDSDVAITITHKDGLAKYRVSMTFDSEPVVLESLSPVQAWYHLLEYHRSGYKVPGRVLLELADDIIASLSSCISPSVLAGE